MRSKDQLRQSIDYSEDKGCKTDLLCWHKTNPTPTCNNTYLSDTEYLLFFREKGAKVYGNYHSKKKYYISPTNQEDKKMINDDIIDVDKILKYNGKFILKCNLILLACVIICLIFMSMTDGLSAVIAGVFGVWLLVFVIIDIIYIG